MPLKKWFRGRRVQATKRRGDLILVKLASLTAEKRPQWIAVTPQEYEREVIIYRTPRREERKDRH